VPISTIEERAKLLKKEASLGGEPLVRSTHLGEEGGMLR
jgi:hypothetical protein